MSEGRQKLQLSSEYLRWQKKICIKIKTKITSSPYSFFSVFFEIFYLEKREAA